MRPFLLAPASQCGVIAVIPHPMRYPLDMQCGGLRLSVLPAISASVYRFVPFV